MKIFIDLGFIRFFPPLFQLYLFYILARAALRTLYWYRIWAPVLFKHMQFILKITRLNIENKSSGSITEQKSLGSGLIQNPPKSERYIRTALMWLLSAFCLRTLWIPKLLKNTFFSPLCYFFFLLVYALFFMVVN